MAPSRTRQVAWLTRRGRPVLAALLVSSSGCRPSDAGKCISQPISPFPVDQVESATDVCLDGDLAAALRSVVRDCASLEPCCSQLVLVMDPNGRVAEAAGPPEPKYRSCVGPTLGKHRFKCVTKTTYVDAWLGSDCARLGIQVGAARSTDAGASSGELP